MLVKYRGASGAAVGKVVGWEFNEEGKCRLYYRIRLIKGYSLNAVVMNTIRDCD